MSDEKENLGALYQVARETQQAAAAAVETLSQGVGEVAESVKVLKRSSADIASTAEAAARRGIEAAIQDARSEVIDRQKAATTAAAKEFEQSMKTAAQQIKIAVQNAETSINAAMWAIMVAIFLAGVVAGAAGFYYLHTPKASDVYLDTGEVAAKVAAELRHRR